MAKKEEPIVDSETGSLKVKDKVEKQPDGNKTKRNVTKVKEKMKMKAKIESEEPIKVDLSKPPTPKEDEVKESNADNSGVVASAENAEPTQEQKEVQPEVQAQETPVLEEITHEVEEIVAEVSEAIKENIETGKPLPENIEKLVSFMEETGGDLNDYVKLNKDYSEMDNQTLLQEYYRNTKSHLDEEEINFLMEDKFSYDEEVDDEREIKRKKLALKEQVAKAKTQLEESKSKYYQDIKSGSKLTNEQEQAVKFYDTYSKEAEELKHYEEQSKSNFLNKTNRFFGDKFKGFEYNVGEKKFRFNVNDVNKVRESQSDINNFIGKFLDEDSQIKDEAGYHKSLFTAMNPDQIANHFYEQGKSDALKQSIDESKNVNMKPRQELNQVVGNNGYSAKALGDTTADFKLKIKNNKFKN